MVTETTFRKPIVKLMREMGAEVLCIVGAKMQGDGWPDVRIDQKSFHGWVEFKGVKTAIEPAQRQKMKSLKRTGATVYIVRAPNRIQDINGKDICTFCPPYLLVKLIEMEKVRAKAKQDKAKQARAGNTS